MTKHKCDKENELDELLKKTSENYQNIKSIEKRLFGNGVKGILQKFDDVCEYITALKERDRLSSSIESWNRKKLLFWGATIFIILQIILKLVEMKLLGG